MFIYRVAVPKLRSDIGDYWRGTACLSRNSLWCV